MSLLTFSARRILSRGFRPSVVPLHKVCSRSFSADTSSFDVFAKHKDDPSKPTNPSTESEKKRKPSEKVLKLVDEILDLSLIEAADLCDLCQEKLAARSGVPAGRAPFPNPGAMFGGMPMGMPMQGMPMQGMPMGTPGMPPAAGGAPGAPQGQGQAQAAPADDGGVAGEGAEAAEPVKEEKKKSIVQLRLVAYDDKKKVPTVKEVRAITGLGLKEAKDAVESAPKVLKKGLTPADAEAMKQKLEAVGATVSIE